MSQSPRSHDQDIPRSTSGRRATLFAFPLRPSRCQQSARVQHPGNPDQCGPQPFPSTSTLRCPRQPQRNHALAIFPASIRESSRSQTRKSRTRTCLPLRLLPVASKPGSGNQPRSPLAPLRLSLSWIE